MLLKLPHRQFVFTFPKMLRVYFSNSRLFAEIAQLINAIILDYYKSIAGKNIKTACVVVYQSYGEFIRFKSWLMKRISFQNLFEIIQVFIIVVSKNYSLFIVHYSLPLTFCRGSIPDSVLIIQWCCTLTKKQQENHLLNIWRAILFL